MSKILRSFWEKRKKKGKPTLSKEDQAKAATVLERLRDLTQEAEREQITLHGTLPARRAPIVQAIREDRFDDAANDLTALRNEFDSLCTDKQNWVKKKNDYDQTKSNLDTLTGWNAPEAPRLVVSLDAVDKRVAQEDFHNAGILLGALKVKVDQVHTAAVQRRPAQLSFEQNYPPLQGKLNKPELNLPNDAPDKLKTDRKTIDDDHKAILALRDKGEYKQADDLIPALTNKIDALLTDRTALDKFNTDYGNAAARIQAIVTMDDDIPDDKRAAKKAIVDLHKEMLDDKAAASFADAQRKLDDVVNNKLGPLEAFKTAHDDAKQKFKKAWASYKYQAEEVINYPPDKAPDSLKNLQTNVKNAYDPIAAELALRKYVEAEAGIAALKNAVGPAVTAKRAHDKAMREYYAALKTLRPRLAVADKVAVPPATLQPLIDDYTAAKGEMITAQNDRNYTLANTKRGVLETAVTALLAARKDALVSALDTETDPAKVATGVQQLAPEEIAELGAKKQLALLKKLHTNPDDSDHNMTPNEIKGRNHLYDSIPLDEDFVKEDKKKRDKIITVFRTDKKFLKAEKEWKTMSDDDRKEFLRYAAKKQCEVMGHPEPIITFVTERECKNNACGDKGVAKDISAFTKVMPEPPPPKLPEYECPTCNTHPVGFDFGGCGASLRTDPKGVKRGPIKLNTIPDAKFDDFGEQLDTVMHENAHAYQLELVYVQLAQGKLKESHPEYKQAQLFKENDVAGYETDGDTYNNQPLERHSWTFGPAIRNGLVGPNVKRLDEGEVRDNQDVV